MSKFIVYRVWRRLLPPGVYSGPWIMTNHTIKARTDKEAESRIRRCFYGTGLAGTSLVAVPQGTDPNTL